MPYVLAYDSGCGPCTRFREAIGLLDTGRRMRYLSLERADGEGLLGPILPAKRFASFHLIAPTGRVWSGPDALPILISLLPGGRVPSVVARSNPLVSRWTKFVYSVLSRLHGAGACEARRRATDVTMLNVDINVDSSPRRDSRQIASFFDPLAR